MRKTASLILLLCFITAGTFAQAVGVETESEPATNPDTPKFEFTEETYDFGEVEEGPKVTHEFNFTNTGNEPMIL